MPGPTFPLAAASVRASLLLRPLPATWLAAIAILVLIAGAAYCLGYEALTTGRAAWPLGLLWSAYAILPWLLLFEGVKRREWDADLVVAGPMLAILFALTAAFSLSAEWASDWLRQRDSAPVALMLLRRGPAIGATAILLMLARREQQLAMRRSPSPPAETEVETLRRHAPSIRWIQAADNYLELHLDGQVWTRRITMREAAALLEPLGFVRIHRSFIVNRSHVAAVVRMDGAPAVKTRDGAVLPAGKAFSGNLRHLH
jgi:hypothetical protein